MSDETPDPNLRGIDLTRIGEARYKATNGRGGVLPIGAGGDPDFTPVELLLAAIAGCSAIDVDLITGKRAAAGLASTSTRRAPRSATSTATT